MNAEDHLTLHGWQRALVVAACAVALLGLIWMTGPNVTAAVLAPLVLIPTAAPLLARRRRSFTILCIVTGVALLVIGVLGIIFGLTIFIPAALLLLIASLTDPREALIRGHAFAATGALLATLAAVAWSAAIYQSNTGYPHTILVQTDAVFWRQPDLNQLINSSGEGIGHGATEVSYTGTAGSGAVIHVSYRVNLSANDLNRLADHLKSLSGVSSVTVCRRNTPGC